jgi:hypothetical protein
LFIYTLDQSISEIKNFGDKTLCMKKRSAFILLLFVIRSAFGQTQLTASQQYAPGQENLTALQEAECLFCSVYVPTIYMANSYTSYPSYTFKPGYQYTLTINGSATASGNLPSTNPPPIYFGVSLGGPVTSDQLTQTCNLFPDYSYLTDYIQLTTYNSSLGFSFNETLDFTNPLLTDIIAIGSFPNSPTASTVTLPVFTVSSPVTGLNIESYPVHGVVPPLVEQSGTDAILYVDYAGPATPTTSTITINNITVTQVQYTPLIEGAPELTISQSNPKASGIISGTPGALVSIALAVASQRNDEIATTLSITTPGVTFTNGSNSVFAWDVVNGVVKSAGSGGGSFYMPASGFVNFSANETGNGPYGFTRISVGY